MNAPIRPADQVFWLPLALACALLAITCGEAYGQQEPPPAPSADEQQEDAQPPREGPPPRALEPPDPALADQDIGPPPEVPTQPLQHPELYRLFESGNLEARLGRFRPEDVSLSVEAVVRAIIGFVALLCLAYLAGHARVREFERKAGIAHLATTGLPFLLMGVIGSRPEVGILSESVLREIAPLLPFGLGWIGFGVGFRFNASLIERLPAALPSAAGLTTAVPFLCVTVVCGALLMLTSESGDQILALRDALLLGAAGAMTARSAPHLSRRIELDADEKSRMDKLIQFERLGGVAALMVVAAYFRPQDILVAWQLPGTAWLFITLGVGTMAGGVVYALMTRMRSRSEFLIFLLGSVCFAAGMASYLRLSAVVVCFLAGVITVNLPGGDWKREVRAVLERLERPIYFLFLAIAGALWRFEDWQGWALMGLFVVTRLAGRRLGVMMTLKQNLLALTAREQRILTLAPTGAISLAIVINAHDLYASPAVSWIVTAVIGEAILMEVLLQTMMRRKRLRRHAEEVPAA